MPLAAAIAECTGESDSKPRPPVVAKGRHMHRDLATSWQTAVGSPSPRRVIARDHRIPALPIMSDALRAATRVVWWVSVGLTAGIALAWPQPTLQRRKKEYRAANAA